MSQELDRNKLLNDIINIIDDSMNKISKGNAMLSDYKFIGQLLLNAKVDVDSKLNEEGFRDWEDFFEATKNKTDMQVRLRVGAMTGKIIGNMQGLRELITKQFKQS